MCIRDRLHSAPLFLPLPAKNSGGAHGWRYRAARDHSIVLPITRFVHVPAHTRLVRETRRCNVRPTCTSRNYETRMKNRSEWRVTHSSFRHMVQRHRYLYSCFSTFQDIFPRQKHLPRHSCRDTTRAKTFRIRLRQDETRDITHSNA